MSGLCAMCGGPADRLGKGVWACRSCGDNRKLATLVCSAFCMSKHAPEHYLRSDHPAAELVGVVPVDNRARDELFRRAGDKKTAATGASAGDGLAGDGQAGESAEGVSGDGVNVAPEPFNRAADADSAAREGPPDPPQIRAGTGGENGR